MALADGRYLAVREEDGQKAVLVIETIGAPAPPRRRRRRPQSAEAGAMPSALPLFRATAIRAHRPFAAAAEAESWLQEAVEDEAGTEAVVSEGIALLNRALHAQAAASADPMLVELRPERAAGVRIGYGTGEEVAAGLFSSARDLDVRSTGTRRRRRAEELAPQERIAAVLAGRERIDACETLLLRARADLDSGRWREAALQLRVGLEAVLVELAGGPTDPGHEKDMAELRARRGEVAGAAEAALRGPLDVERRRQVEELTAICERALRRRRVLRG